MTASRVVEVSERGRRLSLDRGFLVVSGEGGELGRVALDDVSALIVATSGVSYSNPLFIALAERGAVVALCGPKFLPVAWVLPVVGHYAQTRIMAAQARASASLNNRIWQRIVQAKIRAQADALGDGASLRGFAARVLSGDPSNVEAQVASRYFPAMFGAEFKRDREKPGVNELLNYGYTILRSAAARAIVAAGLHPSLGVKHRRDPLSMSDDLMEPLRPLVDVHVCGLTARGVTELTREARQALVGVLNVPLVGGDTATERLRDLAAAVAAAYMTGGWAGVSCCSVRPSNDNSSGAKGREPVPQLSSEQGV
jgi:CRISPR-associated protein Cas1